MPFENRLRKDITDQPQASSSREASLERLQKLRNRAYMVTKEYNKGKDLMTPEMEINHHQTQQERRDNNHQASIQEVIKQRVGKTSSGGKIQLGYHKGLDVLIDVNATIATIKIHIQNMQKYHREGSSNSDNYDKSNERAKKYIKKLKDGYSGKIDKTILQREHDYTGDQASIFMQLYNGE